jgi:hypothetical protein
MHVNRERAACLFAALPLGALLLLSGCGGTVEGRMLHTPETFTGESTAGVAGEGRIVLTSDLGAQCHGPYRQVPDDNGAEVGADHTEENGFATLTCSDGRNGSVMFMVGPDQAVGTGMLGRDIVTLTIVE